VDVVAIVADVSAGGCKTRDGKGNVTALPIRLLPAGAMFAPGAAARIPSAKREAAAERVRLERQKGK
jgi:hypothetical protein